MGRQDKVQHRILLSRQKKPAEARGGGKGGYGRKYLKPGQDVKSQGSARRYKGTLPMTALVRKNGRGQKDRKATVHRGKKPSLIQKEI